MFWIIMINVLLGDSCSANQWFEKWGTTASGTLSIIYHRKVSEIVLILKPTDDIAKSDGEKSYCHFNCTSDVRSNVQNQYKVLFAYL